MPQALRRLLVANRSEIACRIMQTARELGMECVAVYSERDRGAAHVLMADQAIALGGVTPGESYLDIDKLVAAIETSGADCVHPGYGFLAENAEFARRVEETGAVFVGPTSEVIASMGDKVRAREAAVAVGVPVIPASPLSGDATSDAQAAEKLGFPVLVKAAAGGGGKGMRRVDHADQLEAAIAGAQREAASAFGDGHVYLEKLILEPRHIEVQVFGDGRGRVVHLGERECSVQRRHQKIIEEAPSPVVDQALRKRMTDAAVALAGSIDYRGAGTVEFVADDAGEFYFLEMNTRLQVEHAVTEAVTATDLVAWQLAVAAGEDLPATATELRGHAIECRVYAEDPANNFFPTGGRILRVEHPEGVGIRVDSALRDGMDVAVEYDPMLAKVTAWAPTRAQAIGRMTRALRDFVLLGVTTNIAFLIDVLDSERFAEAGFKTTTVESEYEGWTSPEPKDLTATAVAAALAITHGGASTTSVAPSNEGPWERLGAWRLGVARTTSTGTKSR